MDLERQILALRPNILSFCKGLTRDSDDGEDLCQQVMYSAFRSIATFKQGSSVRSWLCRIAINRHSDNLRDARRRPQTVSFDHPLNGVEVAYDAPDPARTAEESMAARSLPAGFWEAFGELSDRNARTFLAFVVDQDSGDEIAETEGISVTTVRTRVLRVREHMRARLA